MDVKNGWTLCVHEMQGWRDLERTRRNAPTCIEMRIGSHHRMESILCVVAGGECENLSTSERFGENQKKCTDMY